MTRFIGFLILAAVVVLLGHPGFASPQFAMGPLLFVLIPILGFYTTVTPPEPQPCRVCPDRRDRR